VLPSTKLQPAPGPIDSPPKRVKRSVVPVSKAAISSGSGPPS
jgi:hypothetical protein